MKTIFILLTCLLVASCTSKTDFTNRAYLDVDRTDGINEQEALAIAEYYFQYKQSAFEDSGSIYVDRNPQELKYNWKIQVISKTPNINIDIFYLVDKNTGDIKESNDQALAESR